MSDLHPNWILPQWSVPPFIKAASTTRHGFGHSPSPYHHFNLAQHVGDIADSVNSNRALLPFPHLHWLEQVHGTEAVQLPTNDLSLVADASFTFEMGVTCVVMTADCLPILLCDSQGRWVAAIHAGWRGLASGIIESTLQKIQDTAPHLYKSEDVRAWLGPAIGQDAFEVGEDVVNAFPRFPHAFKEKATHLGLDNKFTGDLYLLARETLQLAGVTAVSGGEYCTFSDPTRFYSYRRDGQTGRMASLITILPAPQ